MLVRQVPGHEVQGDDLRPLRGEDHPQPRAAQTDGPHRVGRAGGAHLVLQGDAQPAGRPAGHEDHQPGKGDLFPGLRGHQPRRHAAEDVPVVDRGGVPRRPHPISQQHLGGRHGRRGRPQAAGEPGPGEAFGGSAHGTDRDQLETEEEGPDQPAEDRRGDPRQRQPAGMDGVGRDPGDSARLASAGAVGFGQFRHQRLERPLPADHQPQQPAEEAGGPQRAGSDHPQREADVAAIGRRPVRQQPLQAARAGQQQPPA